MENIFNSTLNTRPIFDNSYRFIRSDVPVRVSEEERIRLLERGISVIIDLRTADERNYKECPLINDERFSYFCMPVRGGNTIPESTDSVSESYINMVDDSLYETISFMTEIQSNVLFFCNAGKDRTGVVSAILLYLSGKDTDYIVNDYMKSKTNLQDMLKSFADNKPEVNIDVIIPQERYIKEFLAWFAENNPYKQTGHLQSLKGAFW